MECDIFVRSWLDYPDLTASGGSLAFDLLIKRARDTALARAKKIRTMTAGLKFWLYFCKAMNFDGIYLGVFRDANPPRAFINYVMNLYVAWLKQGHHKQVYNPVTKLMEKTPVMPSTIVHLYSTALIGNKLFGRPVIGLEAMRIAKEYARTHIPKDRAFLSLREFRMLIRKLVQIFQEIDQNSPSKEDRIFNSHFLVYVLTIFPLYRAGNVLNRTTKDTTGFILGCFSFEKRPGKTDRMKMIKFEKTDSGPVPKRTIRWACATHEEQEAGIIGPPEVLQAYLKVYGKSLSEHASEFILKPPTKRSKGKFAMLLQSNHLSWLQNIQGLIGFQLSSLPMIDGIPVTFNNRINRRTAISWHASVAPLHVVKAMAGHASVATTGLYVGATNDELVILQADHQTILLATEPCC